MGKRIRLAAAGVSVGVALMASTAGVSGAADSTNQGTVVVGGKTCTIVSTMVIGTDGRPHSAVTLICR